MLLLTVLVTGCDSGNSSDDTPPPNPVHNISARIFSNFTVGDRGYIQPVNVSCRVTGDTGVTLTKFELDVDGDGSFEIVKSISGKVYDHPPFDLTINEDKSLTVKCTSVLNGVTKTAKESLSFTVNKVRFDLRRFVGFGNFDEGEFLEGNPLEVDLVGVIQGGFLASVEEVTGLVHVSLVGGVLQIYALNDDVNGTYQVRIIADEGSSAGFAGVIRRQTDVELTAKIATWGTDLQYRADFYQDGTLIHSVESDGFGFLTKTQIPSDLLSPIAMKLTGISEETFTRVITLNGFGTDELGLEDRIYSKQPCFTVFGNSDLGIVQCLEVINAMLYFDGASQQTGHRQWGQKPTVLIVPVHPNTGDAMTQNQINLIHEIRDEIEQETGVFFEFETLSVGDFSRIDTTNGRNVSRTFHEATLLLNNSIPFDALTALLDNEDGVRGSIDVGRLRFRENVSKDGIKQNLYNLVWGTSKIPDQYAKDLDAVNRNILPYFRGEQFTQFSIGFMTQLDRHFSLE